MIFGAAKQSLCGQLCLDIVPCGEAVLSLEWSTLSVKGAIKIEDVDHLQFMSLSYSKVVEVVYDDYREQLESIEQSRLVEIEVTRAQGGHIEHFDVKAR